MYKIKNYQAGSIYEVNLGVRAIYDLKDAMLTDSLFLDYFIEIGGTRNDIVCIEFDYGSRDYAAEAKHLDKLIAEGIEKNYSESRMKRLYELRQDADHNKDKFRKCSSNEIRREFYTEGVTIQRMPGKWIRYRMLYRTPGKAKKGSCMFVNEKFYEQCREFLYMGIELPSTNAPVVEIGAYSSLITSTIEGYVEIDPDEILVIEDVDSYFTTDVVSIETNEAQECMAVHRNNYTIKNTMFDGQALIDLSIFPEWGEGYILLRQHFCKMAAFATNIQKYFKDNGITQVTDMFGITHDASHIKLITTNNAIKWLKFGVSYDYWASWVRRNGSKFGVVKTAHKSKMGEVQRMSYQMVNALDPVTMESVLSTSKDYVWRLKTDDDVYFDYLRRNSTFANDYEVLIALCNHNKDFVRSDYFRERRRRIISDYLGVMKQGRIIQDADNLVIVGSPYAMLMASHGSYVDGCDPTFATESEAIQCYTERFEPNSYLAEFRSPFNSRNNLGHLHNVDHPYFKEYFKFGTQIIAINMEGTCFQSRNNGLRDLAPLARNRQMKIQ